MAERDSRGRFVKGNSAGAKSHSGGRPPKDREQRYYEITVSTCTFSDWERIIQKAVLQALRGDHTARKWLADYLVGTPEQNVNLSGELGIDVTGQRQTLLDRLLGARERSRDDPAEDQ